MKKKDPDKSRAADVIPLKDLVPRQDPKGGSPGVRRKTVFGGGPLVFDPDPADRTGKKRPGKK